MADPRKFTRHEIMLGAGNVRFDRDLRAGWSFEPSIGIVAKDAMRLALALESMKEPLTRAVITVMIPSFAKNFAQSGRPERWEPLSPYTLQIKGMMGISDGDKPLIRTGALMRTMAQVGTWDIGNTSATIRQLPPEVWYGAIHQAGYGGFNVHLSAAKKRLGAGASAKEISSLAAKLLDAKLLRIEKAVKSGNSAARSELGRGAGIPQRQFVLFQEGDIDDIQDIFYQWLTEQTILKGRFAG